MFEIIEDNISFDKGIRLLADYIPITKAKYNIYVLQHKNWNNTAYLIYSIKDSCIVWNNGLDYRIRMSDFEDANCWRIVRKCETAGDVIRRILREELSDSDDGSTQHGIDKLCEKLITTLQNGRFLK